MASVLTTRPTLVWRHQAIAGTNVDSRLLFIAISQKMCKISRQKLSFQIIFLDFHVFSCYRSSKSYTSPPCVTSPMTQSVPWGPAPFPLCSLPLLPENLLRFLQNERCQLWLPWWRHLLSYWIGFPVNSPSFFAVSLSEWRSQCPNSSIALMVVTSMQTNLLPSQGHPTGCPMMLFHLC